MELTEPTLANLLAGIDRILSRGFGYRMLVGATGQGTRLLRDDPEEPLPLAEMIRITNSRHVRIWWSLNPPSEPMDLLFCAHRSTNTEDSTPAPGDLRFDPRDNRGTPSDEEWPSSDEEPNSDGHQPESSAAAAKRTTSSRTTRSRNTTKKTGRTHRINWADVGESEPESDVAADRGLDLANGAIPAPDSGPTSSPGKQASVPCANLGTRVLSSSRQRGQGTDLKKAPRTPANNSGKRNLAVMQEADEPYSSDESPEPQRKVARQVGAMDAGIEVEPDTLDGELNLSPLPADRPGPPNSPPPLTSNPGHASSPSEHAEARRSAEHLLMLASGGEQPVNTLATQVGTPGRIHSPSDPATSDVSADIPAAGEAGRELSPAADSPTDPSAYSTPGKFRLRLPGFSSILLARSTVVPPAETGVGSPLKSVSVLAH